MGEWAPGHTHPPFLSSPGQAGRGTHSPEEPSGKDQRKDQSGRRPHLSPGPSGMINITNRDGRGGGGSWSAYLVILIRGLSCCNRSLMLERIQLPTDTVEELSRVHQKCEQITIASFLKAAIFDSDLKFQKQMKVRNQKYQVVKVSPGGSSRSLSRSLSRPLSHSLSRPLSHIGWWFGLQVVGTPHHYRW